MFTRHPKVSFRDLKTSKRFVLFIIYGIVRRVCLFNFLVICVVLCLADLAHLLGLDRTFSKEKYLLDIVKAFCRQSVEKR